MSIVIDASISDAWLFEDERTEAAQRILMRIVETGAFAPALWPLEVANVMRNAVRRKRCDHAFVDASLRRLERLPIEIDLETARHAWTSTRRLSTEEDLTIYDAAYLELALRNSCPLATCDKDLVAAAGRRLVEVLTA